VSDGPPAVGTQSSQKTGTVTDVLPNTTFRVTLDSGNEVFAYLAGKMRRNYVRIGQGDRVAVELSADDATRGKIIQRYR